MDTVIPGPYFGIAPCEAIVTHPAIIGGAAVACRCGGGRWYPSEAEAFAAMSQHVAGASHCDFNESGFAFTNVDGSPLPPCEAPATVALVDGLTVRTSCDEHADLARDEHPEAHELRLVAPNAIAA